MLIRTTLLSVLVIIAVLAIAHDPSARGAAPATNAGERQASAAPQNAGSGEVLYNGIELPAECPPRNRAWSMEPIGRPSYVVSPPAVIPIDIGRQLFVDDFLIEKTSLKRSFHVAEPYPGNP